MLRQVSPVELAERIAAERSGAPFVVYLDGDRRQRHRRRSTGAEH